MKNLNKNDFIPLNKTIGTALTLIFTSNFLNAQIRTGGILIPPSTGTQNIYIGDNAILSVNNAKLEVKAQDLFTSQNWSAGIRLIAKNQGGTPQNGAAIIWDKGTGGVGVQAPYHFFMAGLADSPFGDFFTGWDTAYGTTYNPIYTSTVYSQVRNVVNPVGTTKFYKNLLVYDGASPEVNSRNRVGIGLSAPSEQLHTNQGERFEGLTSSTTAPRLVVQDATGKLFYRNFLGILSNSCSSGNYLPKVDIANTNNFICSQVYDNGSSVGIGTSSPDAKFHMNGGSIWLTNGGAPFIAAGAGLRMYNDNATKKSNIFSFNYSNSTATDLLLQAPGGNVGVNMTPGTFTGSGVSILGAPANPTKVKLDVNGMIRSTYLVVISDEKVKTNIKNLNSSLDKVLNLRGVSYNWKKDVANRNFDDFKQIGFIAQEVEKVLPEVVGKDENGNYAMNYQAIIPVLAEAIKEQNAVISELKAKIEILLIASTNNTTSVKDVENSLGLAEMMQNKPNPFNKETTITCIIPEASSNSVLFIYDIQGKQLRKTEIKQKGKTDITI